ANQCGWIVLSVGQPDGRLRGIRDDVPVRNDVARTVPDESRARTPRDCLHLQGPVVEHLLAGGDVYDGSFGRFEYRDVVLLVRGQRSPWGYRAWGCLYAAGAAEARKSVATDRGQQCSCEGSGNGGQSLHP